jgi:hypothetical protein
MMPFEEQTTLSLTGDELNRRMLALFFFSILRTDSWESDQSPHVISGPLTLHLWERSSMNLDVAKSVDRGD